MSPHLEGGGVFFQGTTPPKESPRSPGQLCCLSLGCGGDRETPESPGKELEQQENARGGEPRGLGITARPMLPTSALG